MREVRRIKGANQLGTGTLEMAKVCGKGTGTESALYDLEKSRGTESITEKSRGRGSAKCGKGLQAKQGFFRTRAGTKRPFNVQNGQDEMAKQNSGQLSETSEASEASLGPRTTMRINGAEGIYGASRRPPRALEHDVNTGGIGGIRRGGITRTYREIWM